MSDARPITDVTDYVCGSCWSSFSTRKGEGEAGGNAPSGPVTCPHCGHLQPRARSISQAVLAAPAAPDSVPSASFATVGEASISNEPTDPDVDLAALGGSTLLDAGTPVAADDADRPLSDGAAPMASGNVSAPTAAQTPSPSPTLLLDPLTPAPEDTETPSAPTAALEDVDTAEFDTGELEQAVEVRLQHQTDAAREAGAAIEVEAIGEAGFDAPTAAAIPVHATEAPEPEPDEWKLKAPPGLVYNFHSLDALIGWVGTKDTDEMQISIDGEEWRPFGPFVSAARDGLGGRRCWDVAGGAPIYARHGTNRSAMDDIADVDAISAAQMELHVAPSLSFGDSDEDALAGVDGFDGGAGGDGVLALGALSDDALAADLAVASDAAGASLQVVGSAGDAGGAGAGASDETDPSGAGRVTPARAVTGGTRRASGTARRSSRSDVGAQRRPTGARPMPEKVALEKSKSGGSSALVVGAAVVIVGAVVAALFLTGVL